MRIEVGKERPAAYEEMFPGMWDVLSPLEFATAIPHVLFAVTTRKKNGKPNVNYHAWSCFQGDNGGFYAILAGHIPAYPYLCQYPAQRRILR